MKLIINGGSIDAPQLGSVADLAQWLDLPSFGTAIELNGAVVRKADMADTRLNDGDRLEAVRLVGGG